MIIEGILAISILLNIGIIIYFDIRIDMLKGIYSKKIDLLKKERDYSQLLADTYESHYGGEK